MKTISVYSKHNKTNQFGARSIYRNRCRHFSLTQLAVMCTDTCCVCLNCLEINDLPNEYRKLTKSETGWCWNRSAAGRLRYYNGRSTRSMKDALYQICNKSLETVHFPANRFRDGHVDIIYDQHLISFRNHRYSRKGKSIWREGFSYGDEREW